MYAKTPAAQAMKTNMNKYDYSKPRSFWSAKHTVKKVKRQPAEWENIFVK